MIVVHHPFHRSPWRPLVTIFSCVALDCDPDRLCYGCNHRLVLDACEIIANNRKGRLAVLQHDGEWSHVATDVTLLIAPATYYFIVDNDPSLPYPIVTDFNAWKFPQEPPAHWGPFDISSGASVCVDVAASGVPLYGELEDRECVITQTSSTSSASLCAPVLIYIYSAAKTCQCAYLSPKCHPFWFYWNKMFQFNIGKSNYYPEDIANSVYLRADLHILLDQSSMVFYPTQDGIVVYFIDFAPPYAGQYHRNVIKIHPRIARAHMYARFAFNVISLIKDLSDWPPLSIVPQSDDYIKAHEEWPSSMRRVKRPRPVRASTGTLAYTTTELSVSEGMYASSFVCAASFYTTIPTDVEMSDTRIPVEQLIADWHAKNPQIRQTSGESELEVSPADQ